MKLEVGMYVRYSNGIDKIMEVKNASEERDVYHIVLTKDEIVFGSLAIHNTIFVKEDLIDLIEVGDILTINQFNNDYEKVEVYETFNIYTKEKELCVLANGKPKRVIEVNIKEILTKEQYEANAYKVGDDM